MQMGAPRPARPSHLANCDYHHPIVTRRVRRTTGWGDDLLTAETCGLDGDSGIRTWPPRPAASENASLSSILTVGTAGECWIFRQLHLTKHSLPARRRAKNFNKHRY